MKRIDDALRLAERLGGRDRAALRPRSAGRMLRFARRENITQIVVGRSRAGFFARLLRPLAVGGVRAAFEPTSPCMSSPTASANAAGAARRRARADPRCRWRRRGRAPVALGRRRGRRRRCARPLAALAQSVDDFSRRGAVLRGRASACASAIAAALLSFFAYDFFFIDPRYEFTIAEPQEFFALLVFLVVAVLTGLLAGRAREQSQAWRTRVARRSRCSNFRASFPARPRSTTLLWARRRPCAEDARRAMRRDAAARRRRIAHRRRLAADRPARRRGNRRGALGASKRPSRPAGAPARCPMCVFSSARW